MTELSRPNSPLRIRSAVPSRESSPRESMSIESLSSLEQFKQIETKISELNKKLDKLDDLAKKLDEILYDKTSSPRALVVSRTESTTKNTQIILENQKKIDEVIKGVENSQKIILEHQSNIANVVLNIHSCLELLESSFNEFMNDYS